MPRATDIIKKEMAYNGFRPKRIKGIAYDEIIHEITHSLYATHHEQGIVPMGTLFCNSELSTKDGIRVVEMKQKTVDELRRLANGRRTFVVYSGQTKPRLAVLEHAISDDSRLLNLARLADGIAIKRDDKGVARIAHLGDLWLVEHRNWERKPPLVQHAALVEECLGSMPSDLLLSLFGFLHFTYYVLSSQNIGATLVWRVREPEQPTIDGLADIGFDLREMGMTLRSESDFSIIQHLVKYTDGAVVTDPFGKIERIGAHLIYREETATKVPSDKGTRHTSAKRFSFEHDETIVFVVSEDGPVSIYSDGYKITEMASELGTQVSTRLIRAVPEKSHHISNHIRDIQCGTCKKHIRIQVVIMLGWKNRETVDCPSCQSPEIFSSMCWSLSARPIKLFWDNGVGD